MGFLKPKMPAPPPPPPPPPAVPEPVVRPNSVVESTAANLKSKKKANTATSRKSGPQGVMTNAPVAYSSLLSGNKMGDFGKAISNAAGKKGMY